MISLLALTMFVLADLEAPMFGPPVAPADALISPAPLMLPIAEESFLRKGRHELSLHVAPDFEGPVGDTLFFEVGYGQFVNDALLVRANLSFALLEDVIPPGDDYRTRALSLGADYHFRTDNTVVPYVGVDLGWRRTQGSSTDESGLVYGPRVGAKFFVTESAAIDLHVAYEISTDEVFIDDFQLDDTDLTTAIGLRLYW